jgi:hypothetical protein
MLRSIIVFGGGLVVATSGCGPSRPEGAPNSALTVPDVPPAGPNMKKGPLDPKPAGPSQH